jgi:geranylgeranyl pyrophosphate synthase
MGKPAGTDAQRGKMTYVGVHGLEEARRRARALVEAAVDALDIASAGPVEPLRAIAHYIVERPR